MYKILIAVPVLIAALTQCSPTEISIKDSRLGSDLGPGGKITSSSLIYTFKITKKFKTNRDFFNYIYFEGDTVCFRILFNKELSLKGISIIYKTGNTRFPAERVDTYDDSVAGFTLLGSLLEHTFKDNLDKPFNITDFYKKKIPVTIECTFKIPKKMISHTLSGTLLILLEKE